MLFRKKIARSCQYCSHETRLNECEVLCAKRGIINANKSCLKFQYDPCKRIPPKAKASDFAKYDTEDYSL